MDALLHLDLLNACGCSVDPDALPLADRVKFAPQLALMLGISANDTGMALLTGRHPATPQFTREWADDMGKALALVHAVPPEEGSGRAAILLDLLVKGRASEACAVAEAFLAADTNARR